MSAACYCLQVERTAPMPTSAPWCCLTCCLLLPAGGAYGTPAYFYAVVLFDLLPMRMLPPTFFALISYWMVGLHPGCASCITWFVSLVVGANVASATMCMAIGAAAPSNSLANMVGGWVGVEGGAMCMAIRAAAPSSSSPPYPAPP